MAIQNEHGAEVASIYCEGIEGFVVETDGEGGQVQSDYGQMVMVQPSRFLNAGIAPEDCPLFTSPPDTRQLTDFAACIACKSAEVEVAVAIS